MSGKKKKTYEVVIIGAGMAGMACARRLAEAGVEFLLISKDIGGRIKYSADGRVPYGTVWMGSNYRHVGQYVQRGRRVARTGAYDYSSGTARSILRPDMVIRYPLQLLKMTFMSLRFLRAYLSFQKRTETVSQKQAIEESPYLRRLYFQDASEFVVEKRIEGFAREFIEPVVYGITTNPLSRQTAFTFMLMSLSIFLRGYEFYFDVEKFTEPFREKMKISEVARLEKQDELYQVTTTSGEELFAKRVVVATPSDVAQKLIGLPRIKEGRDVYVIHVKGKIKKKYAQGYMKIFGQDSGIFAMLAHGSGDYIVGVTEKDIDLTRFFEEHEMVAVTGWHPIYHDMGKVLLDSRQGERLWLVGDHNIIGLEDAFLTGFQAAGEIIEDISKNR